jgi:DNA-binding transcriptional regulator YdaS (Cro superfamily)
MTLEKYFETKPRGSKTAMARALGISKTWLSLVVSGRRPASPELCVAIERYTKGAVSRRNLRPDVFGAIR